MRLNGRYVLYDETLKKYINITANSYIEDLTTKPFNKTKFNY